MGNISRNLLDAASRARRGDVDKALSKPIRTDGTVPLLTSTAPTMCTLLSYSSVLIHVTTQHKKMLEANVVSTSYSLFK